MKFHEKESVTRDVTIGRKVQYRKDREGQKIERAAKSYTAEYRDAKGQRKHRGLGTTNKREARRLAVELQRELDSGVTRRRPGKLTMNGLMDRYYANCEAKGLAPKSLAKYRADLAKLKAFCEESGIVNASQFTEEIYHEYGAFLRAAIHVRKAHYASKTVAGAQILAKQLFKWARRQHLISEDPLHAAEIPFAKAAKQPCFETYQVEAMLELAASKEGWHTTRDAIAILAYTGLRVGELCQLRWSEVLLDRGEYGMIRVTRGGSLDRPKDKDERIVPIHKRIRPIFDRLPRNNQLVLPCLRPRTLLARIKRLSWELGYSKDLKTHSLRHHFVSWCASNGVPIQQCLAFTGHSSWTIARTYYSLSDEAADTALQNLSIETRRGNTR